MAVTAEFVRSRPAARLRPFVAWYAGYRESGVAPGLHRGLPSPYLTLIITLDDPLVIAAHPDPHARPGSYDTLVGGLHTTPALITHDGRQSGVQLGVTPLGARALMGLPSGELVRTDLEATDVLGPLAERLRERLLTVRGWRERFAVLDSELLGSISRRAGDDRGGDASFGMARDMAYAWHRLLGTRGVLSIAGLATEVGWSGRHLGTLFRTEFGLGPKEAARVIRFDRARRMLPGPAGPTPAGTAGPIPTLAEVAATCGYYDQAHLAREFGTLAGCPPSRWLAEEFRNVQVAEDPAEADSVT